MKRKKKGIKAISNYCVFTKKFVNKSNYRPYYGCLLLSDFDLKLKRRGIPFILYVNMELREEKTYED